MAECIFCLCARIVCISQVCVSVMSLIKDNLNCRSLTEHLNGLQVSAGAPTEQSF